MNAVWASTLLSAGSLVVCLGACAGGLHGVPDARQSVHPVADRTGNGSGVSAACGVARYVPNGSVQMAIEEENVYTIEAVSVGPFCLDRTEVTIGDYVRCVAGGGCSPARPTSRPKLGLVPQVTPATCELDVSRSRWGHPVVCVSFWDARAFCAFRGGRLPSEAEWIRATAGAGGCDPATRTFPDTSVSRLAIPMSDGDTSEVGTHPEDTSAFGIVDMLANAMEWSFPQNGLDRLGGHRFISPSAAVFGGLARDSAIRDNTLFTSDYRSVDERSNAIGFRCAYEPGTAVREISEKGGASGPR